MNQRQLFEFDLKFDLKVNSVYREYCKLLVIAIWRWEYRWV